LEHVVDISAVFPDFNADVNDPASYDFVLTDEYTKAMLDNGTKPFYRLGSKIEHWSKKYGTLPPADFGNGQISVHTSLLTITKAGPKGIDGILNTGRSGTSLI